jgi:hypothetical protein
MGTARDFFFPYISYFQSKGEAYGHQDSKINGNGFDVDNNDCIFDLGC